ncbi:Neprilysin-2 [Nymphon striatum]|nr:Neprilysin-2 [Nymphon striatum]
MASGAFAAWPVTVAESSSENKIDPRKIACEVTIIVLLAITTASTIALALAVYYLDMHQIKGTNMCYDDECVMTASSILSGIDESLDPCDDFFKFSCNKWIEDNILVNNHESRLGGIGYMNRKRIKEMLEQQVSPNDTEHIQKSLNLYSACVNESMQDTLGADPLLNDLKYAGGWPAIEGDSWSSNKTITDVMIDFYDKGLNFEQLVGMEVARDFGNSSNFILGSLPVENGVERVKPVISTLFTVLKVLN